MAFVEERECLVSRSPSSPSPTHRWVFESFPQSYHLLLVAVALLTLSPVIFVRNFPDLDPFVLASFRSAIVFILAIPRLVYFKIDPEPDGKLVPLGVRAMFSAFYTLSIYYGFRHLSLADSRMVAAFQPVLVAMLACVLIGEACQRLDILSHILFFVGTLALMRPSLIFEANENIEVSRQLLVALTLAVAGTLFQAGGFVTTRMVRDVDVCVVLVWNGLFGMIPSLVISLTTGTFHLPREEHTYGLILCGVMAFVGQACLTIALQVEEAGRVAIVSKSYEIIVAFVLDFFCYAGVADLNTVIGAVFVGMAVLIISLKPQTECPEDRKWKEGRCWWWLEYM